MGLECVSEMAASYSLIPFSSKIKRVAGCFLFQHDRITSIR